jgi:hypothetical protein
MTHELIEEADEYYDKWANEFVKSALLARKHARSYRKGSAAAGLAPQVCEGLVRHAFQRAYKYLRHAKAALRDRVINFGSL